jgi:hypothetical protein
MQSQIQGASAQQVRPTPLQFARARSLQDEAMPKPVDADLNAIQQTRRLFDLVENDGRSGRESFDFLPEASGIPAVGKFLHRVEQIIEGLAFFGTQQGSLAGHAGA